MTVSAKTRFSVRFLEPTLLVAYCAAGLVLLAASISGFLGREVLDTLVRVPPGEAIELTQLTLKPRLVGATRIDTRAEIPANRWLTYEIQLRDAAGKPIAAGIKQAWHEWERWQEDGETGTWQEWDVKAGLDVRVADAPETVTLTLVALEYTHPSGVPAGGDAPIRVRVRQGVVDRRYLVVGGAIAVVLALLTRLCTRERSHQVISASVPDHQASDRASVGGKSDLVKVVVKVVGNDSTPEKFSLILRIYDEGDRTHFLQRIALKPRYVYSRQYRGEYAAYFHLSPAQNYRFSATILPRSAIDRTLILVYAGVRSAKLRPVTYLEFSPAD